MDTDWRTLRAELPDVVRYMRSIGGVELVLKTPDGKETRVDLTPETN